MSGVRLGGLWWKKDQNGKEYLEGTLGMAIVRMYMNEAKKNDTAPDAALYVVEKPQKPQPGDDPHPYAPQRSKPKIIPKSEFGNIRKSPNSDDDFGF